MSTVNANSVQQNLQTSFAQAASDGQITRKEAKELTQFIDSTGLPDNDKNALKGMVSQLNKATTGNFLFFSWKSKITPSEMQGLQNLAQTNSMAKDLLQSFQSANPAPQPQAPSRPAQDQTQVRSQPQQASFSPGGGLFGGLFAGNNRNANRAEGVAPLSSRGGTPPWIVSQNGTGLSSAGGDCGPASAAMVARRFGCNTDMSSREAVQAARAAAGVTRPRGGAWAIDENEVTQSIQNMTGGQVRETADTGLLRSGSSNRQQIIDTLRSSIARGDMPILLTGSPSSSSRHYMVVTDVQQDGSLIMADPAGGRTWRMTPERLSELMQKADRRGGSRVMAYNN